jgi:hypothetical protein
MTDENTNSPPGAAQATTDEKTCGCGPDCNCGPGCACGPNGKCAPACTCDA